MTDAQVEAAKQAFEAGKGIRAALRAADAAAWRGLADTLPVIGDRVLVHIPGSNRPVQEACRLIAYEGSTNWWWETPNGALGRGYMIRADVVTKWRPLPNAPAEDADRG
jgi:hypothetical protein